MKGCTDLLLMSLSRTGVLCGIILYGLVLHCNYMPTGVREV